MQKPEGGHLRIEHLRLRLGAFQVADLSLEVEDGQYFVLLGPTGAGKTVLLETIAGLHRPEGGRLWLDGEDITARPPEQRGIGFVYQDYVLFPHRTVAENVAFGLALRQATAWERALPWLARRRLRRLARAQAVTDALDLLHIGHLADRHPRHLSGGERQRVALARALVVQPRVLLLDEPLSALDPQRREALRGELRRIHRALSTTVLHVTHDFEEAVALADRIAVVHAGRIEQVGTPEAIFRRPATPFVAEFVGVRNLFAAQASPAGKGITRLAVGGLTIIAAGHAKGKVHLAVRPEDIVLSRHPQESSLRNVFQGRVTAIEPRGALVYVTVEVPRSGEKPLPLVAAITAPALETLALRPSDPVTAGFKASAVHVF